MLRVASVPACHPYVMAVIDPDCVEALADPVPLSTEVPGQWWPPRWLDPDYLRERIGEIDLLHVHFGFDAIAPETLARIAEILIAHHVPLITTVHDLHNPHFVDAAPHLDKLDALIAASAAVITLTPGAARSISARWRRTPIVLPHPHLLPLPSIGAPRVRRSRPVVAVHGKALRANLDPWTVLDFLCEAGLDAQLRFDLDNDAMTSPHAPPGLPNRLARYASCGVDVRVHAPFSDAELGQYLNDIDVLVLAYRFGTHSGWVESCFDAGVGVVAPDCGHFSEQKSVSVYRLTNMRPDRADLLTAVGAAVAAVQAADGAEDPPRRQLRARERRRVRLEHAEIYRRCVLSARKPSAPTELDLRIS